MAKFDLYKVKRTDQLVVQIQHDVYSPYFSTVVVIPLVVADSRPPAVSRLHPTIKVDGRNYVVQSHAIGAISLNLIELQNFSLSDSEKFDVMNALDTLTGGG
ncbi:MAG: CcdB family protein [Rhodospirillaceae bacterium]